MVIRNRREVEKELVCILRENLEERKEGPWQEEGRIKRA